MSSHIRQVALGVALAAFAAAPVTAEAAQTQSTQTAQVAVPAEPARQTQPAQDRATTVEFKSATRLPGITLQPGTYVFRLGPPATKQNVVEVYSADGTKKIATLLTVDYATPPAADATTVIFEKTNPPVLRAWYFPGETVGREFVYAEDEAKTIYTTASTPVLWAAWDPNDRGVVGRVEVQTVGQAVGQAIGQAARTVADVAKDVARGVADVAGDVWDDIEDNARLVNPTESRKAAERHLDMAERAYDQLEDRLDDAQEAPLKPMRAHLEALEDAFEKNDAGWMAHYTALVADLNKLVPEGPVGTSGKVTIDASTTAALVEIRGHLSAFHAQAMK